MSANPLRACLSTTPSTAGMVVPPFIHQQRIDELKDLPLHLDDLFIASFPKSGTTWTRQIVKLVLNNGEDDARKLLGDDDIIIPWLAGHSGAHITDIDALPAPRVFYDHYALYGMMPGGPPNSTTKVRRGNSGHGVIRATSTSGQR